MKLEKKVPKFRKCYNCKFAGDHFKIAGKTYLHCHNEELYPPEKMVSGEISHWDTLKEFWERCKRHQFRD